VIGCGFFYDELVKRGIDFFAGVPDSLLKEFCAYLTDHAPTDRHIIAANEGAAVALACGYHLATGKTGLVYMQNAGQGNALNPLVSLADAEVYSIGLLLLIGWRGEPGTVDEPQHKKQGRITLSLLETLEIPYQILPDKRQDVRKSLDELMALVRTENCPAALIVRKGTFNPYKGQETKPAQCELAREDAIKQVVDSLGDCDIIVSTTGKTSRELYEYRGQTKSGHHRDFLTVGSMGHCSQIALGIALSKPDRNVYCLDGDGSVLMHMGSLPVIGSLMPENFRHIILNNGCHDSVGGQPTCGFAVSFTGIATACGYRNVLQASTREEIDKAMASLSSVKGPALLEIKIRKGARDNLTRPATSPLERKTEFMEFLSRQCKENT